MLFMTVSGALCFLTQPLFWLWRGTVTAAFVKSLFLSGTVSTVLCNKYFIGSINNSFVYFTLLGTKWFIGLRACSPQKTQRVPLLLLSSSTSSTPLLPPLLPPPPPQRDSTDIHLLFVVNKHFSTTMQLCVGAVPRGTGHVLYRARVVPGTPSITLTAVNRSLLRSDAELRKSGFWKVPFTVSFVANILWHCVFRNSSITSWIRRSCTRESALCIALIKP